MLMTDFLIKTFIKDNENYKSQKVRKAYGILSGSISVICNLLLFGLKFAVGMITNSISITADAFNNLSDLGNAVATYVSFYMVSRPADKEHPFGHARFEYLSSLMISLLILGVGVQIVKESVIKIFHPEAIEFSAVAIAVLLISIFIKLWMYFFNNRLGDKINSQALKAVGTDSITDCYSTGMTLVGMILRYFGLNIDAYLGLCVGILILYAGWKIAKDMIGYLVGKNPDPRLVEKIRKIILGNSVVTGVHDIVIHDYGPGHMMGSAHAEVPTHMEIVEIHDAVNQIEEQIRETLGISFLIHADPIDNTCKTANHYRSLLTRIAANIDPNISIHDFQMSRCGLKIKLMFDIVIPYRSKLEQSEIKKRIDDEIQKAEPGVNICTDIKYDLG